MPLFGLRTKKKNEQSQIETAANEAKTVAKKTRKTAKKAMPTEAASVIAAKKPVAMPTGSFALASDAIIRPHITEKAGVMSQNGVYTFQVNKNANKDTISKAVKSLYKVTPVKVGIVNVPAKQVFVRGKRGSVSGFKKAIVTLKKGDKIDFV